MSSEKPQNEIKQVLVPVEGAKGECYHAPGGCGGHLVTTIEATAAELIEDRDLRPCQARGCRSVDIPTPTRCDGCGTPIFDPESFNDAEYCKGCATHLHKHPSKQNHEQYALLDTQLRADGGRLSDEDNDDQAYQVVMHGHGPFSAPYTDEENAEERANGLEAEYPDRDFSVEPWPNHRQEEKENHVQ